MKIIAIGIAVLITFSLHGQNTLPPFSKTGPTVQTVYGIVRGITEGDVSSFRGIPYAAAPVGEYRWRPPQRVTPWKEVRDATKVCADCPQRSWPGSTATISEDCLFLNVWTPATATKKSKLPVMVWIHGGGFTGGSGAGAGSAGDAFAKQGVILATINYRLGRLGHFAFPALSKEHLVWGEPARMTARAFVAQRNPAYMYQFGYVPATMRQRARYGAGHGSEISFVFNTLHARWGASTEPTPEEKELATIMNTYWANFAKTGNPNGKGLPHWPLYDTQKEEILDIDLEGKAVAKPDPRKARLNVIEKAFKQRARLQARGI